jgi:hypothetical protein
MSQVVVSTGARPGNGVAGARAGHALGLNDLGVVAVAGKR